MWKLRFAVLAVVVGAVALIGAAGAGARSKPPPGNSQADQYIETVPGAGGGTVGGSGGGTGGSSAVPASTERQLNDSGAAGQAAAQLAQSTAPRPANHKSNGAQGSGDANRGQAGPGGGSGSGIGNVAKALTGSSSGSGGGGLGIALPLVLAAIGGAGIMYAVRRRAGPTN